MNAGASPQPFRAAGSKFDRRFKLGARSAPARSSDSSALREVGGLDALLHGADQVAGLDEATPSCAVVVVEES
jgi:hypothetical protein